jgi:hypothetical protein
MCLELPSGMGPALLACTIANLPLESVVTTMPSS